MDFSDNNVSEIFFVDGAEIVLNRDQKETLSSAAAHFIECFDIDDEVDVYISKKSVLHKVGGADALAWHVPPQYNRNNHVVCVFVDPEETLECMIISLAHEMIHAWQVNRGDMQGTKWNNQDYSQFPYPLQPWEIEAHAFMKQVAGFYFEDRHPSASELSAMTAKTKIAVKELNREVGSRQLKNKVMKVAKVAGLVGLGALFGI
jgi:hypothetical protein